MKLIKDMGDYLYIFIFPLVIFAWCVGCIGWMCYLREYFLTPEKEIEKVNNITKDLISSMHDELDVEDFTRVLERFDSKVYMRKRLEKEKNK